MRIGLAADTYKPYISGVTNYVSLLKAELERLGHEVVVFTFGVPQESSKEENVVYSPGFRLQMGYCFGLKYSHEALRRIGEMDLIHVHHPFITGQLILRAVKGKKPLVFTAHTRYDYLSGDYAPKILSRFGLDCLRWYLPGFCRRMDRVICNSPASVEGMRNCHVNGSLDIVPNGIDLKRFQHGRRDDTWRQRMGNWPVQYLYTGRLAVEKGLPLLLEGFACVARLNPDVGLALVGRGPMENALREQSKRLNMTGRVTFLGAVDYDCMPDIVSSADIFVTASVSECHPLTVIEAMAAGLPPVVAQSSAYDGMIEHGRNGLVCAQSVDVLAEGMRTLAEDKDMRLRIGLEARNSSSNYSIEKTSQQVLAIYSAAIEDWKRNSSS